MRRREAGLAAVVALAPAAAQAHAFSGTTEPVAAFLEGARVIFVFPELTVPIASLAVALGLRAPGGLARAWPHFFAATLLGLVAASFVGPWAQVLPPLAFGVVLAMLAALVPPARLGPAVPWLGALIGLAVVVAVFEGYTVLAMPWSILAGVVVAANLLLAAVAGLVQLTRARVQYPWVTILWRVVASWLAAIQILYLAFLLAG